MPSATYAFRLTIAPADLITVPKKHELQVPAGEIEEIIAQFPTGCNGAAHVVLDDSEGQVFPVEGGDLALSGGAFPFKVKQPLSSRNGTLTLIGWADAGNTESHVIDLYVTVRHAEAI